MERKTVTVKEKKVTFECDGRIKGETENRGWQVFFAVDDKYSFPVLREGYFEVTDATTVDTADFTTVKKP